MNILHRKLSLPLYGIIGIWTLILISSVSAVIEMIAAITDIFSTRKHFEPSIAWPVFFFEAALIGLWRISNYRRQDLESVMKQEGVQLKKRNTVLLLFASCFFRTFPQGSYRDSYVIALVNGAYSLPLSLGDRTHLTPDNVLTDRLDFISLIDVPFILDEEIRIDKEHRIVPNTGIPEIDGIIEKCLFDIKDFHARMITNKGYFRIIVISSPWLGGRYETRVKKGFELFSEMDKTLRQRYQHKRWEGREMFWNGEKKEFEPRMITH